ncbi:MAG: PAS domain S-box protein [Hyphomonadaceae bacterium]|nr:PAS domain S-box protein [Hyphomonadaceae bacterium]
MTLVSPPTSGPEHRFRDLLDGFPAAVYTTDARGFVTFYNTAAEMLAGRTPQLGRDQWSVLWKMFDANGAPLPVEDCPMAITLRDGVAVRDVEILAERPDGSRVHLIPFPTPLRDGDGNLIGAVNMLVDITAVKRAEAALAQRADTQSALYRFTDRLHRAKSTTDVSEAALDAILIALRCHRASVLLFDEAGVMRFVGARGLSQQYRDAVTGHTPWTKDDLDAQPIIVTDVESSDLGDNLKSVLRAEGIGALGFFPLISGDRLIGKFMTYFDRPHPFAAEETDLALTIARQIGFALGRAQAEASLRASEERYRAVVEGHSDMIVRFRRDGVITFANAVYAKNRGSTPEALMGSVIWDLASLEYGDRVRAELSGLSEANREVRLEMQPPGRTNVWTLWTMRALSFGADGAWDEVQCTGVDITERKLAEQAIYRLSAIVEFSGDAIISKNLDGIIVSWNEGAERLLGYTADEIIGQPVTTLMFPEHQWQEQGILDRIRRGERIMPFETVRRRKDGSRIDVSLSVSPVRDSQGNIVGASKIARDISERKRADEQRTLLIHELNHRVKNTLATVQSLTMQTLRNTERSTEARALLDARLAALSRAHDLLTAHSWEGAGLRDIVHRALQPFRTSAERVVLAGPDVRLSPKQAVALSIALHELATNASKYGALSGEFGRVSVQWRIANQTLSLVWSESGGPLVETPTRTGFGTRLIERSLAHDLGGAARIQYLPGGVVAEISTSLGPALIGA